MRLGQIKTIISTPFRRVSTKLEGARGGGGWWRVVIHEVTRLLGRLKSSISYESHKTVTSQSHAMSHGKQKVIQLNSTRSITTKYDRLVTCCAKEPLKEAKPFKKWNVHVGNENRYISLSTGPLAIKPGKLMLKISKKLYSKCIKYKRTRNFQKIYIYLTECIFEKICFAE